MKGHISKSTAALFAVIALLVGALVVTISSPNRIRAFADTTRGAETGAITTFAPVVKRAMPAVVNISSSKVVKEQGGEGGGQGLFSDPLFESRRLAGFRVTAPAVGHVRKTRYLASSGISHIPIGRFRRRVEIHT